MQEHGFWLTSADQFMVEIAASLMAKQRGGNRPVLQRPTGNPFRAQLDPASAGYFFGGRARSWLRENY
jgi:hypothetical protein